MSGAESECVPVHLKAFEKKIKQHCTQYDVPRNRISLRVLSHKCKF